MNILFQSIYICLSNLERKEDEVLAENFGILFNDVLINDEVYDFLSYKISRNIYYKDGIYIFIKTLDLMTKNGMLYYTGKVYINSINHEAWFFIIC